MDRVTSLEKDMDYLRGVKNQLFTYFGEEKIQMERQIADQEKKIKLQKQTINEQGNQINQRIEMLGGYSPQGATLSQLGPLSSPIDQFCTPLPM